MCTRISANSAFLCRKEASLSSAHPGSAHYKLAKLTQLAFHRPRAAAATSEIHKETQKARDMKHASKTVPCSPLRQPQARRVSKNSRIERSGTNLLNFVRHDV